MGQILQSSEPARSVGAMAYRGAPGKDGSGLYILGIRDKAKSLVY
jgi:hypothetical protein